MLWLLIACSDYSFTELHRGRPQIPIDPRTDYFGVEAERDAQVLFVVDASCSMEEELTWLTDSVPELVEALEDRNVALQLGLATTQARRDSVEWARDVSELDWPAAGFSGHHRGAQVAIAAVEDRSWSADAARHVVFYSDHDDRTRRTPGLIDAFDAVVDDLDLRVHAVVRPPGEACAGTDGVGTVYAGWADRYGGEVLNICEGLLALELIAELLSARTRFPLVQPAVPESISVRVSEVFGTERVTRVLDVCETDCPARYDPYEQVVILEVGVQAREEVRIDYMPR